METVKPPPLHLKYLKCHKNGIHEQENINIVCLEKSCLENSVGCVACIEEDHKKHKTKPLKMMINQAKQKKCAVQPAKINVDIMLDILKDHQQHTFQFFNGYKKDIMSSLEAIERTIQSYFDHTSNQIMLKNSDSNLLVEEILERATDPKSKEDLQISIKKIIALQTEETGRNLSEEELKQSLQTANINLQKSVKASLVQAKSKLISLQTTITNFMQKSTLWQTNYKFSEKLKHQDIKLVSETKVKAGMNQGYKFALMEPGIEKIGRKVFSFSVRQSKSNWLAVGFCHKKTVEEKGYSFKFGTIGHGAYMMSSNGGSWSNHKVEQNNTLKGIKFGKGDIVHATIDSQTSTISFTKNSNTDCYQLSYQLVNNEEMSPCVLFYYRDDQVEYLPAALK